MVRNMGITGITAKTFAILKRAEPKPEIIGEGIEFTSGLCIVNWLDGRAPIKAYENIQVVIREDVEPREIELVYARSWADEADPMWIEHRFAETD